MRLLGVVAIACAAQVVGAASAIAAPPITVEAHGGWFKPDGAFADFQWDVLPRPSWGAQVLWDRGRFAGGLRALTATSTQDLAAAGGSTARTTVRTTTWEAVGRARLVRFGATRAFALASAGRVHLGWSPDRVSIDPGTGTPVEVDFAPVNEWIAGAGLSVRHAWSARWDAGIDVDHRWFSMETAHRNGDEITVERRTFGNWGARAALAWRYGTP